MKKLFVLLFVPILSTTLFAQSEFVGTWEPVEEEGTFLKIYERDGEYIGEIIESKKDELKAGTQIIKNFEQDDDEWTCELYAVKKREWKDAEIKIEDDLLKITVSRGFTSKTLEWKKAETKTVEEGKSQTEEKDNSENE